MAKRIRYIKTKDKHILKSNRVFLGQQDALYQVYLNIEDNTYKIKNVRRNAIISSTEKDGKKPPKNLYTLKEQAKRALKKLGVKFELDLRGI